MNRFDETAYKLWLSDLIRSGKKSSPYFTDKNAARRDIDVIRLTEEIAREHYEILEKLLAFTVDARSRNVSQEDVLKSLGFQDKGASVIWHDRDGNEVFFVNTDKSPFIEKRKIAILNGAFSEGDIKILKQRILREILRKDVEKIYRKIAPKENLRLMKEKNSPWRKEISVASKGKFSTAAGFEKDFKDRIKEQGAGASSAGTFSSMVNAMSGEQAKSLLKTLNTMGIKPGDDFKNLLSMWRTEALNEKFAEYKKAQRKISPSQDQEMGMEM